MTLAASGEVGTPSLMATTFLDAVLYFINAGTKAGEVSQGAQPVNCSALGTTETADINPFIQARKKGPDEAVPP